MIAVQTNVPPVEEFSSLMRRTDDFLNQDAFKRQNFYSKLQPDSLEEIVTDALKGCAKNTPFEDKIRLVSGASFPDIVARDYYGIEVKSTNKNKWVSTGSSILESTRVRSVERIFLTFGKLGKPVSFKSRPYEECLSGIAVTHYPRYQIDMNLSKGETIFDKMSIPYDTFRKMENPIAPVSKYYKKLLKPGQSLWWSQNEIVSPPILRLWNTLSEEEKKRYTATGFALFPEVFSQRSAQQYHRYVLWLATHCSIIIPNVRDLFSAGGKVRPVLQNVIKSASAIFGKVNILSSIICSAILSFDEEILKEAWGVSKIQRHRIEQWIELVAGYGATNDFTADDIRVFLRGLLSVQQQPSAKEIRVLLPLYSLRAACGCLGPEQHPTPEGNYVCVSGVRKLSRERHFIVRAIGDSMIPKIHNGDLCVFEWGEGEAGKTVLLERTESFQETSGSYVIKNFDGTNQLKSLNRAYPPIEADENCRIKATLIGVLGREGMAGDGTPIYVFSHS